MPRVRPEGLVVLHDVEVMTRAPLEKIETATNTVGLCGVDVELDAAENVGQGVSEPDCRSVAPAHPSRFRDRARCNMNSLEAGLVCGDTQP